MNPLRKPCTGANLRRFKASAIPSLRATPWRVSRPTSPCLSSRLTGKWNAISTRRRSIPTCLSCSPLPGASSLVRTFSTMDSTAGAQTFSKPNAPSARSTAWRLVSMSRAAKSRRSKTACRQLPAMVPRGKEKISGPRSGAGCRGCGSASWSGWSEAPWPPVREEKLAILDPVSGCRLSCRTSRGSSSVPVRRPGWGGACSTESLTHSIDTDPGGSPRSSAILRIIASPSSPLKRPFIRSTTATSPVDSGGCSNHPRADSSAPATDPQFR